MKITQFLRQSPDYQIHLAGKRAANALNQSLAKHEINLTQALILVALYFEEGHQAPFENLAETFEVTKGGLSHHLSELEARKLIHRRPGTRDRRAHQIFLATGAHSLCVNLIRIFDGHQRQLEETFGEKEIESLLTSLKRISKGF